MSRGYRAMVGLISGWLVVVLVATAAWFMLTRRPLEPPVRFVWYLLVSMAVLRAGYRTHVFFRRPAGR